MNTLNNPDYIIQLLAGQMERFKNELNSEDLGITFVLGAGCSAQYGLPDFKQLIEKIFNDNPRFKSFLGNGDNGSTHSKNPAEYTIEELRRVIDPLWNISNHSFKLTALKKHLSIVNGSECPGYVRLARLASDGYIDTIVNMNFDSLLEDAFDSLNAAYYSVTSFAELKPKERAIPIIHPHGSIKIENSRLVLEYFRSEFFDNDEERATPYFTNKNVVLLGYSCADGKITNILRKANEEQRKNFHVYVINIRTPHSNIEPIFEFRNQSSFRLEGYPANFENFMERLEKTLTANDENDNFRARQYHKVYFTGFSEDNAIDECKDFAQLIQASFNIVDLDSNWLNKHADDLLRRCKELSEAVELPLKTPERFILRCVSYLHDLGLLKGMCADQIHLYPGFKLRSEHGKLTRVILEENAIKDKIQKIIPNSYDDKCKEDLLRIIKFICEIHTANKAISQLSESADEILNIIIDGINICVRKNYLLALFSLAEELYGPSEFPNVTTLPTPIHKDKLDIVDDPIISLSSSNYVNNLSFLIQDNTVSARVDCSKSGESIKEWRCNEVNKMIKLFNSISQGSGGKTLEFNYKTADNRKSDFKEIKYIQSALEFYLGDLADSVPKGSVGELPKLLDLLSIFTLPCAKSILGESEPRVSINSQIAENIIENRIKPLNMTNTGLLDLYFNIKMKSMKTVLEESFINFVEDKYYYMWRYIARCLDSGIEPLSSAMKVFDLGSTGFRSEVIRGLNQIIRENIYPKNGNVKERYGHQQCMLCTGRLLYIGSLAKQRLFFAKDDELERKIDEYTHGIIDFLLQERLKEEDFMGSLEEREKNNRIRSIRYISYVIRCIALFNYVYDEIKTKTGEFWFTGFEDKRGRLNDLIETLINYLSGITWETLESKVHYEENLSLEIGECALTYYYINELWPDKKYPKFFSWLDESITSMLNSNLSIIDEMQMYPALILFEDINKDEERRRKILDIYNQCMNTFIWINKPEEKGFVSWGGNNDNTNKIVSSLVCFWRYVIRNSDLFEILFEEKREKPI